MDLDSIPFVQAQNYTKGRLKPVQLIVLHDMEAPETSKTAANVAHYFATSAPASAHFCIDDVEVIQCVRLEDTAWQCKNANANGIGLEHAGYAKFTRDNWLDDYGKKMLELSAQLAAELCKKYEIPAQRATFAGPENPAVVAPGFCMHYEVPLHGSHTDPGPNFPIDYYLERVGFYLGGQLPDGTEQTVEG